MHCHAGDVQRDKKKTQSQKQIEKKEPAAEALKTGDQSGPPGSKQRQSFTWSLFRPPQSRAKTRGASQCRLPVPDPAGRSSLAAFQQVIGHPSAEPHRPQSERRGRRGSRARRVRSGWINNQGVNLCGSAGDLQVLLPTPPPHPPPDPASSIGFRSPSFSRDGGRRHFLQEEKDKELGEGGGG